MPVNLFSCGTTFEDLDNSCPVMEIGRKSGSVTH